MLKLTRLNNHTVAINPDHITWVEETPDTTLSFINGDEYTFMDSNTFEQLTLNADMIGEPAVYLTEGMVVTVESYEGSPISVTLPETVVCLIVEADAVVKGQTASSSYKPAKLENGVRVMVPPHVESGTKIVVRTADSEYMERAKD